MCSLCFSYSRPDLFPNLSQGSSRLCSYLNDIDIILTARPSLCPSCCNRPCVTVSLAADSGPSPDLHFCHENWPWKRVLVAGRDCESDPLVRGDSRGPTAHIKNAEEGKGLLMFRHWLHWNDIFNNLIVFQQFSQKVWYELPSCLMDSHLSEWHSSVAFTLTNADSKKQWQVSKPPKTWGSSDC